MIAKQPGNNSVKVLAYSIKLINFKILEPEHSNTQTRENTTANINTQTTILPTLQRHFENALLISKP